MAITAPPSSVCIIGASLSVRNMLSDLNKLSLALAKRFKGLCLAISLTQKSITCSILEARSEHYDLDGHFTLSPNGLRILDKLGVYERVKSKGFHFETMDFKNSKARTLSTYRFGSETLYEYNAMRITRKLLIDELVTIAKERSVNIVYNAQLTGVVSDYHRGKDVVYEMSHVLTFNTSLLIGCDGLYSTVREHLYPRSKPIYSGLSAITCTVPRSSVRIPDDYHLPTTILTKRVAFTLFPQNADGSEIYMAAYRRLPERDEESWSALRRNKGQLLAKLRENAENCPDIVQSVLAGATENNLSVWPMYSLRKLKNWASRGSKVAVLGDAAHPIPPTVGQGADQALEDAYMLAIMLANLSPNINLIKALGFWQSYRQDRVRSVLKMVREKVAGPFPAAKRPQAGVGQELGGDLRWLYYPDYEEDIAWWLAEHDFVP